MQTVWVPLPALCADPDQPQLGSTLEQVVLHLPDPGFEARLLLDTFELVTDPYAQTAGDACGTASAEWICESTNVLEATEYACDSAPESGACPTGHTTTAPVALPQVDDGQSLYDGWVVHTPAMWVKNPNDPTTEELEAVEALCVRACERQWLDNPDVSANCDASGAFETPVLLATPSLGPMARIPRGLEDGSGIFGNQWLECSLADTSCCVDFDEHVCVSALRRVTPAGDPLGVGEEWRVGVSGTLEADSPAAAGRRRRACRGASASPSVRRATRRPRARSTWARWSWS
jgi:hypothetical protein